MSDTDESAVLVDTPSMATLTSEPDLVAEDEPKKTAGEIGSSDPSEDYTEHVEIDMTDVEVTMTGPRAYQIVSIGTEDDKYAFQFDKDKLQSVLEKVPSQATVAVVSVVGAFRTGKSFLLSWFLRYLEHLKSVATSSNSAVALKDELWYNKFQSIGNDGFDWKAGAERNTTGIWIWSEPYMITDDKAVLLIDTQGMFDHETTMALTASIFGISTLLSSYQIYNVDKRIQEDNLQQLALFSEYARTAVGVDETRKASSASETIEVSDDGRVMAGVDKPKPFQHIEFLVRDWQHFDDEEDGEGDYEAMAKSMETYLESVIADRDAKDLKDTREQILSCFEKVTCYGLCHPGTAVTKKSYIGDVSAMDRTFLELLVRYCAHVFDPTNLQAKTSHGNVLTADQLGVYIQAYAELFASGANFPTAETLLEATAKANNTNAVQLAVANYKEKMNRVAGPQCTSYLRLEELRQDHSLIKQESLSKFEATANFGSKKSIDAARDMLLSEINSALEIYESLNEGRNPLAGFEVYVLRFSEIRKYMSFPCRSRTSFLTLLVFVVWHQSQLLSSCRNGSACIYCSLVHGRYLLSDCLSSNVRVALSRILIGDSVLWNYCRFKSQRD
jgi:atlastin